MKGNHISNEGELLRRVWAVRWKSEVILRWVLRGLGPRGLGLQRGGRLPCAVSLDFLQSRPHWTGCFTRDGIL